MKTVVDEPIVEWLAANGYFYVMHRFDVDNVAFAKRMRDKRLFVSISSGVRQADYTVIDRLASEGVGADYITINIAHGHADTVHREHVTPWLRTAPHIVRRNVALPTNRYANWRWTLDYPEDLSFVKAVLEEHFPPFPYLPGFEEVRALVEAHPEIASINAHRGSS